ncbi:NfeD family protein [Marinobacterium stanieri]|uniref:NfeD family protein n=1 Tax=Marinobacterium stanieri TaxID=49186 RepID=UPI003A90D41B
MTFQIEYWHWVVFGMLLMMAEIVVPSFTIFWFGLGAMVLAALLAVLPDLSLSIQMVAWALVSCAFALAWFKFLRPHMVDRTKAGVAREAVMGETGQVILAPQSPRRGQVRFSTPVLGADEWEFICDEEVETGDRVMIVDISGNTLIVKKRA